MSHHRYAVATSAKPIGWKAAGIALCPTWSMITALGAVAALSLFQAAWAQVQPAVLVIALIPVSRVDADDNWTPAPLPTQNEAGMASSQIRDTDLQDAFVRALKSVEELRKKDRSTVLECTYLFAEFHRYQQTEPYVLFFKSVYIPALLDDRNQRHYVAFSINHQRLWSMGYKNFLRGDRLGIVFTTSSAASTEVTSFRVTLLNSDHL